MQFYLDTLPGNQEIAQYVGWHCQIQDLRKNQKALLLPGRFPHPKGWQGTKRVKAYWRIERRGGSPEEARSSRQRLHVQLPSPAAAAEELRKLLAAAVLFGGGRMLGQISRTAARSGRGLGSSV